MIHRGSNIPFLFLLVTGLLLASCASYNKQVSSYYTNLRSGNYDAAAKALDHNKLLAKNRNRLLYLLERGKVCHLLSQYDSSNMYFNEADQLMESGRMNAKDVAIGTLLNPMMQSYRGEDFEKYLVHYYKAINYLRLGQPDEALVEAKRISLRNYTQEDKTGNRDRYADDAFSFMLQGMIYEANSDVNNAFIAYRNAADVFLQHDGRYYGVKLPQQLKKDVLRTARNNGFIDEMERYGKLFDMTYQPEPAAEGGELILFWENGSAPVKQQQDLFFTLAKGAGGSFFFTDAAGLYNVPFDFSTGYSRDNIKLEDLRSFRVALPKYQAQPVYYSNATVNANSLSYNFEEAENINTLAFSTLQERMGKELTTTLTRLAIKKLAEAAARPKEKDEKDSKKEKSRKDRQEAFALGLQLFNFASEKADTRNWQSLPHTIFYTRIPLKKGANEIMVQLNGPFSQQRTLTVTGTGRLQFRTISSLK